MFTETTSLGIKCKFCRNSVSGGHVDHRDEASVRQFAESTGFRLVSAKPTLSQIVAGRRRGVDVRSTLAVFQDAICARCHRGGKDADACSPLDLRRASFDPEASKRVASELQRRRKDDPKFTYERLANECEKEHR
jgi:hypothetical protein